MNKVVHEFTKIRLNNVPLEDAHGGAGKRQMLLDPSAASSSHWEAITKGLLKAGEAFDWHVHENIDEVFIVLKGRGKFFCDGETSSYNVDDIFITPANLKHKIEALEDSEFYFIRVKV